jgi:hypothetical protein
MEANARLTCKEQVLDARIIKVYVIATRRKYYVKRIIGQSAQ